MWEMFSLKVGHRTGADCLHLDSSNEDILFRVVLYKGTFRWIDCCKIQENTGKIQQIHTKIMQSKAKNKLCFIIIIIPYYCRHLDCETFSFVVVKSFIFLCLFCIWIIGLFCMMRVSVSLAQTLYTMLHKVCATSWHLLRLWVNIAFLLI